MSEFNVENHRLGRRYSAGSEGQRRSDRLVRRWTLIVGTIAVILVVVSLLFLYGVAG